MGNNYKLREIREEDREAVVDMMCRFYASPAVQSNGSEEIFNRDIDECVSDSEYVSGFVFEADDGSLAGYSILARGYSTEYGRPVVWIEDIFLEEDARGCGLADMLFDYVKEQYPDYTHRLEAERDNARALRSYEKNGFHEIPYVELLRHPEGK